MMPRHPLVLVRDTGESDYAAWIIGATLGWAVDVSLTAWLADRWSR